MNHHSNKKDPRIDPMCRLCGEGREKPWHLAVECDAIHIKSRLHLGQFHSDRREWTVEGLGCFISERAVWRLLTTRVVIG